MARALVIDNEVRTRIKAAMELAAKDPIALEVVKANATPNTPHLKLKDRNPSAATIVNRSQHVDIPIGYRAAISYEWQPVGLCKHLSVSVNRKGFLPSPESVTVIAQEFGIKWPDISVYMWIEEFDPGHEAINIVAPVVI